MCLKATINNRHNVRHNEFCGCDICACSCNFCDSDDDCCKCFIGCITFAWLGVIAIALVGFVEEFFTTAFSFLAFIAFFFCGAPFLYMIVAFSGSDYDSNEAGYTDCDNVKSYLMIIGICHVINFLFCLYLMCRYGIHGN